MSTRNKIIKAAISMLSAEHCRTIDKISVQSIVKDAGTTRTTFYKYFRDKYDLTNWIFYHEIDETFRLVFYEKTDQDPVYELLNSISSNKTFYRNIIRSKALNSFPQFLFMYLCLLFTRFSIGKWDIADYPSLEFMHGVFDNKKDFKMMTDIIYNAKGCAYSIINWISADFTAAPEEFLKVIKNNLNSSIKQKIYRQV